MMKRIVQGTRATVFERTDFLGNKIDLSDYRGRKVLLSFFRGASCPFCNLRVRELAKRYDDFEKARIQVIAVFAANQKEIVKHAGMQKPPFTVIPDPTRTLYQSYGVESSQMGMLKTIMQPGKMWRVMTSGFFSMNAIADKPLIPADFMIDDNGVISVPTMAKTLATIFRLMKSLVGV
ncbi:MAG: peroxiredoxin-like family protein [Cyclobacteriaceae bacterium]